METTQELERIIEEMEVCLDGAWPNRRKITRLVEDLRNLLDTMKQEEEEVWMVAA
jgi:hypothetical protein